jgi:hypothetical protein
MSIADIITMTLESYLDDVKSDNSPATYFHASKPPSMPIYEYLKRLEEFMKCSDESFILALIYLDRITERESDFVINHFCIHRLFLAALVVAAKFIDDKFYKNDYYARVGGVANWEMNILEHQFLGLIDFNLYVHEDEFSKYQSALFLPPSQ